MTKSIKIFLVVLALALVAWFAISRHSAAPTIPETATTSPATTTPVGTPTPASPAPTPTPTGTSATTLKQEAWDVLQRYLAAAKAHDLPTLTSLSYQVSAACLDTKQQAECYTRMDNVYKLGTYLRQSDFKNIVYDQKQIIMTSDYQLATSTDGDSYSRSLLYFTRKADGTPQVLYFTPNSLTYNIALASSTPAETLATLKKMITDTDGDTLDDEVETCSYVGVDPKTCVKTNPLKKDSNGDGWWDSIEVYFYKNTGQ